MSKYLFLSHASPSWKKRFGYVISVVALALVFALYSIPEVVIGFFGKRVAS